MKRCVKEYGSVIMQDAKKCENRKEYTERVERVVRMYNRGMIHIFDAFSELAEIHKEVCKDRVQIELEFLKEQNQ